MKLLIFTKLRTLNDFIKIMIRIRFCVDNTKIIVVLSEGRVENSSNRAEIN